ncbi:hypothetical protein TNCV_3211061 [Trichonephila clavipes]|uniref:C2H2-type domain-containing protein n=1 Tax=Trichonephila clavipes TaxID=2585209 RepID=A0A8X6SAI1_TRICX|nr:hypothetical protein TNCV_3211061 [Trichonephila clavipes]
MVSVDQKDVTHASVPHGDATVTIDSETCISPSNRQTCVFCEMLCDTADDLILHMEQLHEVDTPQSREVVRVIHDSTRANIGNHPLPLLLDPAVISVKDGGTTNNRTNPKKERGPITRNNGSPPPKSAQCGMGLKTKKGLTYHMLQVHGVPIQKRERPATNS